MACQALGLAALIMLAAGCGGPNHLYIRDAGVNRLLSFDRAVVSRDVLGRWQAIAVSDPSAELDAAIPLFGGGAVSPVTSAPDREVVCLLPSNEPGVMLVRWRTEPLDTARAGQGMDWTGTATVRATSVAGGALLLITGGAAGSKESGASVVGLLRGTADEAQFRRLFDSLPAELQEKRSGS